MAKKEVSLNMTEGKIARVLLAFAVPIFVSNLFQQLYNVVDTAVIGHVLGDDALAAVGATTSIFSLLIGFVNGMSNGFGVVLARLFGAGDENEFHRATALSIAISFILTILLTAGGILFLDPVLRLLHTPESIMGLSADYISIVIYGIVVTFAYNLLTCMFRAVGNSRTPLYALVIASLLNIVLDVLFVKNFSLGVRGAALATVIAQAFSTLFLVVYMVKKCPELLIARSHFQMRKTLFSELLSTGFSMAMMLVLTNIGTVALQSGVNSFGTAVITGHTAARKFHDLCMLPFGTICTSAATFVSQNYGAKKFDRIKQGIRFSLLIGTAWAVITLAVTLLFGSQVIRLLTGTSSQTVLSIAMKYLHWNVPFYVGLNILLIFRNSLQALGSKVIPLTASFLELAGKFACVFCLVPIIDYLGICLVEPITWLACIPVVVAGLIKKMKEL